MLKDEALYRDLARRLLVPYKAGRWEHVQGVARKARRAAGLFTGLDADFLVAAAWLHDIGYADSLRESGFHPLDGARFLADRLEPERLCALVAHHSGSLCEAKLRKLDLDLLRWADECTPIRDALWWADMTTSPHGTPVNVYDRITEIRRRYGPSNTVSMAILDAAPMLIGAAERTMESLRSVGLDTT